MAKPAWSLSRRQARERRRRQVPFRSSLSQRSVVRWPIFSPPRPWLLVLVEAVLLSLPHIQRTRLARRAAFQARAVLDGASDRYVAASSERFAQCIVLPQILPRRILTNYAAHTVTITIVITAMLISNSVSPLSGMLSESVITRAASLEAGADVRVARSIPVAPEHSDSFAAPALRFVLPDYAPVFEELYAPREGETLGEIAARYGVSVTSLFWANGLQSGDVLVADQELRIPRLSGIPYVVQAGDTLESVAQQFNVSPEAITLFPSNRIGPDNTLPVEREIFIPSATPPYPPEIVAMYGGEQGIAAMRALVVGVTRDSQINLRSGPGTDYPRLRYLDAGRRLELIARHQQWIQVKDSGNTGWVRGDLLGLTDAAVAALPETNDFPPPPPQWVWPSNGEVTSAFGWRKQPFRSFHDGLDLANRAGTQIVAASGGQVTEAGWCGAFGYCVKIDHGDGITTLYAHMLKMPPVVEGDTVAAGDLIGWMGSTYDRRLGGYSTGVHLHFILKVNGKPVDPLKFLT